MKYGLFWVDGHEAFCITRVYTADEEEACLKHKEEWDRLPKELRKLLRPARTFDYFPRGRVTVRRGRATVFYNPDIPSDVIGKIMSIFELDESDTRKVADGSCHYGYRASGDRSD